MDLADFDDVIAAAEEYLPNILKLILGKSNVQTGLQMILQYFQNPLLNKQVNQSIDFSHPLLFSFVVILSNSR